jgi:hypothetical protein
MFCFMGNIISSEILFLILMGLERTSETRTKPVHVHCEQWTISSINLIHFFKCVMIFAVVKIVFISNYFCSVLLVYREGQSP